MSNRNRHLQYRRSVYRKSRLKLTLILSVCSIVLAFVIFIVLGNILHKKSQSLSMPGNDSEATAPRNGNVIPSPPLVGAYALPLLEEGSTFSQRLANINSNANAVCIALNKSDGTLLFNSTVASDLGIDGITSAQGASSLSNYYMSAINDKELRAVGVLYIPMSDKSTLLRNVDISVWGAIAGEALQSGVQDVLFIPSDMSDETIEDLCRTADKIRKALPESFVGITLTDGILSSEERTSTIAELNKHFNFLAFDTTNYKDEPPLSHIESKISAAQHDLIYYNMRVLLPFSADTAETESYISMVKKYNISSWQIIPN